MCVGDTIIYGYKKLKNMHKYTRMRYSRDKWKDKAVDRADQLRTARKKEARMAEKLEHLEVELTQAKHKLQQAELEKKAYTKTARTAN